MTRTTRLGAISVCAAAAGACGLIFSAAAQDMQAGASDQGKLAFDVADTNGDGIVTEGELTRDAAAAFSYLDADRSGTLTPDELDAHDPEQFSRVDLDGDGELTFIEVMTHKVRALEQSDDNDDGGLSYEEMVKSVAEELGGAQ